MDVGELGPGDRHHLGGRVELHRARAERDHRAIEREVLVGEAAQVAQHLVLGVVAWNTFWARNVVGAPIGQPVGTDSACRPVGEVAVGAEQGEHRGDGGERRGLVEAEPHVGIVDRAQVEPCRRGPRPSTAAASQGTVRVSNQVSWRRAMPASPSASAASSVSRWTRSAMRRRPSGPCHAAYSPAMLASSTWAVQMLEVAFSRRMCCSRVCSARRSAGRPSVSVLTPTSRPGSERVSASLVAMNAAWGPPNAHRHPEALGRADDDVGAELTRGSGEHAGEQVGRRRPRCARRGEPSRSSGLQSGTAPLEVGRLSSTPKQVPSMSCVSPTTTSRPMGSARVCEHGDRLRVGVVVDEEAVAAHARHAVGHRHRLGGRRGLVEQRGVGDLEAGELGDHRLEVEQRLEPALADLGLVGRVRRVPGGVLEHVAQDHRGH